jgi:predicted secreted protein
VSIEQAVADLAHLDAKTQRLRSQQAEIDNQRAEIDNQLADIDEQARRLRTYVTIAREYAGARSEQGTVGPASTAAPTSDTSNGKTLSCRVTDMAVDLIRAKGQPIHTRDLLPQMTQRSLTVGGRNPVANLSGYLCRDKTRLVSNRNLGWSLVEWGGDTPPNDPPKGADATSGR